MKLGSLFDGSGTAPLAAAMCGIEPVWASEIEPYPIKVTKARFPNMLHLGDITKINGAEVEPVDIICGGSPCQDLSVAGKQKGLQDGERSHLFFEMSRIIKQMREATNGKYPRYIIWENVPGAFSSNKGRDFHAVLQAFAEIADPDVYVPEPESKAGRLVWKYAGEIMGDGWSVAWRTMDAQYWGVPQRRRRIYLVADFAGERAGEILFERTSVPGNLESGRTQREEIATDTRRSTSRSGAFVYPLNEQIILRHNKLGRGTGFGAGEVGDPAYTLQANHPHAIAAFMGGQGAKARSIAYCNDGTTPTIKSVLSGGNTIPDIVYAADCRNCVLSKNLSATLQANGSKSLNGQNPIIYSSKPPRKYIVRRFTPLECCRLQGFPDWWEDGVEGSDSARYKMWGNGMALPNMLHVMRGIVRMEQEDNQWITT